jgi:hypothetical protein
LGENTNTIQIIEAPLDVSEEIDLETLRENSTYVHVSYQNAGQNHRKCSKVKAIRKHSYKSKFGDGMLS